MTTTQFTTTLVRENHVRRFEVRPASSAGWEASEHEDHQLIRRQHYRDWHRVEQALARFARTIEELREQGWHDA
jgi:hypothetical protein